MMRANARSTYIFGWLKNMTFAEEMAMPFLPTPLLNKITFKCVDKKGFVKKIISSSVVLFSYREHFFPTTERIKPSWS
jgi:hypothetical protein